MPNLRTVIVGTAALLLGSAGSLSAQLSVELRGGAAIGNHAPAAAGLETIPGPSASASLDIHVRSGVHAYAGYTYASFGCEDGFCTGQTVTLTSSGFGGGVRFQPGRLVWVRLGLLYHGTEVESEAGVSEVDPSLGYDLGAGLAIPLYSGVELVGGVAYRSHTESESRTSVVVGEVGLRVRLLR